MKSIRFLTLALCLTSISGCTGWDDGILGSFKVRSEFTIQASPRNLHFRPGNYEVKLAFKNGLYGVYDPSAVIKTNGSEYEFSIPRELFSETGGISASASQLHQSFAMIANTNERTVREWEASSSESCTFCGTCYSYQPTTDSNGQMVNKYTYGTSCTCPGNQNVRRAWSEVERSYRVRFISPSAETIGELFGKGNNFLRSVVLGQGSCS